MDIVIIILAIALLFIAHVIKTYRWSSFINVYEKPQFSNLLRSLSFGYIINFLVPFKIGDVFRGITSGRKMKNGVSFSLATVIIDRILDMIVVAFIFIIFIIFKVGIKNNIDSIVFYLGTVFILIVAILLMIKYNKYIKILVKKTASIFNEKIELNILKFSWFGIRVFKDIFKRTNKKGLFISTIIMWIFYMVSYSLIAAVFSNKTAINGTVEIFTALFSKNTVGLSTFRLFEEILNNNLVASIVYVISPLIMMFILSYIPFKYKSMIRNRFIIDNNYLQLLPQINQKERLNFLELYFSGTAKTYFENYLKVNADISILKDYSAGSNATTMLCTKDEKTFFRKYAFGKNSDKLYEQIEWLKRNAKNIPLTIVENVNRGKEHCAYDMPFKENTIGCFTYVHSYPLDKSWKTIENILIELEKMLYSKNEVEANKKDIYKYIDSKVIANIEKITASKEISKLLKFDELIINGKTYKNLSQFERTLDKNNLYNIFKSDTYTEIHGDLTIENIIICPKNLNKIDDYYLIDPNTGNIHESANLDYAKLLQSIHGGYEFLMNNKSVEIYQNEINYLNTQSLVYNELFKKYKDYLEKKFPQNKVKSIFFHEIVHWLRLMPYKIEKDDRKAVLFYAGLIIVLNDVIEMYGD